MTLFQQALGLEFWMYVGWQFYLETLMWVLPEDDPPDGGIPQGVAYATPL